MASIKITKQNFEDEVLKSGKPVLLDFWAAWCGPCRMVSPTIEEMPRKTRILRLVRLMMRKVSLPPNTVL